MPLLFSYLFKFSVSIAVVYVFYQLVLRRLTFYQWNRFYLLGYSLLCFAIPFIHIDGWIAQASGGAESGFITVIPALGPYPAGALPASAAGTVAVAKAAWGLYDWMGFVLLTGTVLMTGRLTLLFLSLQRLRRKSVLITDDTTLKLYETAAGIAPFSFGRSVYFNPVRHTAEELEQIMRHEYVHVKQRHTIDLLAGELLCLVNWYNPFAWLVRYSIRQNLEFIADSKVLENGVDKKEYQYLLLKVVGISQYRIANHFNFSNLKKRIVMMNKMKSARLHLGRFLFVLPLLAVLLVAFRGAGGGPSGQNMITAGIVLDVSTRQPLAGVLVKERLSGVSAITNKQGFYSLTIAVSATAPATPVKYFFVASLEGYDSTLTGFSPAPGKVFTGSRLEIIALRSLHGPATPVMFMPTFAKIEENDQEAPTYEQALKGYYEYVKQLDDLALLTRQLSGNPQVQQFYTTEDKKKQVVFLKNGGIEKYGYPGTPPVAEMEKRYGQLPSFSKEDHHPATYYNKQWQDISERLTNAFIPSGDAKAVVFPGDSRVLVQSPDNKVTMYDMDYQQDRDKFEALYGKLPGLPPAGRSDTTPNKAGVRAMTPDTVPSTIRIRKSSGIDTVITGWMKVDVKKGEPLILVDGKERADVNDINPADIEHISVFKDTESIKIYGDKGRNGVILVTTKWKKPVMDTVRVEADTVRWSAAGRVFELKGNPQLSRRDVVIQSAIIDFRNFPLQLAMKDKLLDMNRDFTLVNKGGRYELTALTKAAAMEKYGIRTKDGVLEIRPL